MFYIFVFIPSYLFNISNILYVKSQDSLVADLVRHDVDGLEVSALVDCAGGGGEAHPGHRGQAHHLAGDLHVPIQDVDIKTRQDDRVIPVKGVAVSGNILRCLPLNIYRVGGCCIPI